MKHVFAFTLACSLLFLASSCADQETAAELFSKGQKFEQEEKFDEALHAYEKLTKIHPDDAQADDALQKAAFIYYNNSGDFHKAIECHERLVEHFPESDFVQQAQFMVGFIYANDLKDLEKAKVAYNEFLELHPDSELADDVQWELEHLGQDVNEQLLNLFGDEKTNGEAKVD